MDAEEQGYNDFWHYDHPRQPKNPKYMEGWNAGWDAYFEADLEDLSDNIEY